MFDCVGPEPRLLPKGSLPASFRVYMQGRLAFQALYQFLLEGRFPSPTIRVVPHIVMASNLDMFADGHFVDAVQEFGARSGIH